MNEKEQANAIWDILVEECGAQESGRRDFVAKFPEFAEFREYRFSGDLGFGGKVWHGQGFRSPYVTYYPEDTTPLKIDATRRANVRLAELVEKE